ncbi:hypothetical protein PVAR5_6684 [Paecilomyces variotii No. 5]|uniref:Uncharacterized protein n=1 Tax=Byssochlamys spectabilis (strain No. 5 / NBRC 109023) TaxID=1356009 RepID=V5G7L5_BYSSN|nr:hypothetical protein PVAR5_6684 [Paecilomyces variotii No. 5]
MAKTKTNDQQPHTARERAKTKPSGENGVQRRRPLKWDLRQENLFLATALRLNPVRPDFRAIAEELGTDIVSAATLRKRLPEIFKRASAVLKERRDTSGLFTSHDVQKSPEDRPDKSDTSSESQSPGPSTPPSTMRARQASDKIKSSASSRYALTPHDKYKNRGFPYTARYDTPHTCSPNEDAGSPYTQTSNREYSSSESEEFRGARTFTPSSNNTQFHKTEGIRGDDHHIAASHEIKIYLHEERDFEGKNATDAR